MDEINNDLCKKKDEEVFTETNGSLFKNSLNKNNNKITNDNNKNVEISDKKFNPTINTFAKNFYIKKFAESERQSSIASTSSFSEDTTGSNISSIATTSRSITSKEVFLILKKKL